MPFNPDLAAQLIRIAPISLGLEENRMMGGFGYLLNKHMCVGIWHDFLVMRVGEEKAESYLTQPGFSPMDITGKPMRGWVKAEAALFQDDQSLRDCFDDCVNFVLTLPPKPPKADKKSPKKSKRK